MPNNGENKQQTMIWSPGVSHKRCLILPKSFSISTIPIFSCPREACKGHLTDFRLRSAALELKWASSISLQNSDMCLQSFVTATPPAPCCRDVRIFMLSGVDGIDGKFAENLESCQRKVWACQGCHWPWAWKQNNIWSVIFINLRSFWCQKPRGSIQIPPTPLASPSEGECTGF